MYSNRPIRLASVITAVFLSALLYAGSLRAQQEASEPELEQLRGELLQIVSAYEDLAEMTALSETSRALLTRSRHRIENASLEDLRTIHRGAPELRDTGVSARALRAMITRQEESFRLSSAPVLSGGEGLPSAPYTFCGSNRSDAAFAAASEALLFTAEIVREEAGRVCDHTVVILGEGGNTSVVCIITDALYIVAKALHQALVFCDGIIDAAEIEGSYERLAHIHDNLETSIANDDANAAAINGNINAKAAAIMANDNANTHLIVANDNANAAAIIANDNANKNELRDLILRTQIEAALATADNSVPLGLYQTPGSVCSGNQCGRLDLVREVVAQTLANTQAAGESIGGAQSSFDQGDALMASGQFKAAYQAYRKAYKTAVK